MGRIIGIRHRIKKTAKGEARPTTVCVLEGKKRKVYNLDDETAELDFILGRFPIAYRDAADGEDFSQFLPHHVRERKVRGEDTKVVQVPLDFDGLHVGDRVAMTLGGSGDRFAFASSRNGDIMDVKVFRISPSQFKQHRIGDDKDNDHALMAELLRDQPDLFYEVLPRDRDLIRVSELVTDQSDTMRDRIRCGNRLHARLIGSIFLSEKGGYPEGKIEDWFAGKKASDEGFAIVSAEEAQCEKLLAKAVQRLEVYGAVFQPITGCGPMLAARIIAAIGDIRRYGSKAALKAFAGVHVNPDGSFVRRRRDAVANWHPELRQAIYLLVDQFIRRPESEWGQRFLAIKAKMKERHPEEILVDGKRRYYPGHIHKMAIWRCATKFVEALYRDWKNLESRKATETSTAA